MNRLLFSVIIPTFNRAHTIIETLDSVKSQTYRPIEIVIVDDGSVDETRTMIAAWTEKNQELQLKISYNYQDNAGSSAARNRGIAICKGEFIQFLDSDDTIYPNRLEKLVEKFEEGYEFIETGFEGFIINTQGEREIIKTHLGHVDKKHIKLLLQGRLWANTLRSAFTRTLIEKVGLWNEKMSAFEDYEYVIRTLSINPLPKVISIREVLASARRDGGKRISNDLRTYKGRNQRIHCEELIGKLTLNNVDIPTDWKKIFLTRMLSMGLRCEANGWHDLGARCLEIVQQNPTRLNFKNQLKMYLLKWYTSYPGLSRFIVKDLFKLPK